MKKQLFRGILLAALLLSPITLPAQGQWNDYAIRQNQVTYQGQVLPDADAKTFQELGFGYGKDQYNVYYQGEVLEFADPTAFKVNARFTRHHRISTTGMKTPAPRKQTTEKKLDITDILGLDGEESGTYSIQDNAVTYEGQSVQGADAATFVILKAGYAKDDHHAYYQGQLITNALGGKYFIYQDDDYASDGQHTYFKGKEVNRD